MRTRLELTDDDGSVWQLDTAEDGETTATRLGHVMDDWQCPSDRLDEWAALASRWMEETAEGRAERAMWRDEYKQSLGSLWR